MRLFSTKILTKPVILITILGCMSITTFANEPKVLVNGRSVKFDQPLLLISNTLLAPIKPIADSMKVKHYWNKETQTVTIAYRDTIAIISAIDSIYMNVKKVKRVVKTLVPIGEQRILLPISPKNHNGVAYFPIEAIAKVLLGDKNVTLDNTSNTLRIRTPDYREPPITPESYRRHGITYLSEGQYDMAIKNFTEAIRLDPSDALAYYLRGVVYRINGQYDIAIQDFTEAIRLDPNYASAYSGLKACIEHNTAMQKCEKQFWECQEHEKTPVTPKYANSSLNTIGISIGTSFATPAFITTVHGIFAPIPNMYLELGLDLGLIHSGSNDSENNYYSVEGYYSLYPFVNAGYFLPFTNENGWYLGAGVGYMFGKYTFEDGKASINIPAFNMTTGFIVNNFFNISYTLRTNFEGVNNKVAVGIVYRFE